jgi:hypothetical protein
MSGAAITRLSDSLLRGVINLTPALFRATFQAESSFRSMPIHQLERNK